MRGTHRREGVQRGSSGLIPTYAGNTWACSGLVRQEGAHPHVCGEHSDALSHTYRAPGSSPRMRGTQQLESAARPQEGLIPTYAGNTCFQGVASRYDGAHPHVCGEHGIHRCARNPHKGSSPRMRGTLQFVQVYVDGAGLIPTYAGNTCGFFAARPTAGAHPHVCGEHLSAV